ncbi:CRISPR-associated ATP-dependent helicase [Clostridioides difficile]|uniref:CRISPR-associated helicase Cas3' n=1 Tax=Clostridioides difficile TaxID=1496 RepID=UPI001027E228|nr:CRISPR-associated helicase Cas3' [Clostridioides difficile]VFF93678.1 CRISPR-associated ATP-dependent helicase [Clostridioides difficile]VIG09174.1 CRISPR-associated ATP-dependent helicase [Clostridioides difficile]
MKKELLAGPCNLNINKKEQTLVEHIKDLFEVLESILDTDLFSDKDIEILKICCALHDLGKINLIMQQKIEINNKISSSCSKEEIEKLEFEKKSLEKIARHNVFSGSFLKSILEKMNLSEEDELYIYKSIMLHHGSYIDYMKLTTSKVQEEIYKYIDNGILENKESFNLKDIEVCISEILNIDFKFNEEELDYDYIDKLSESMVIESDYNNGQIDDSILNYRKFKYILYKGMLNLIDHVAQGTNTDIKFYNDFTDKEIDEMILSDIYNNHNNLEENNIEFNTIQKRLRELSGKNVLTVAFTGSGKKVADCRKNFKRKLFLVPNHFSSESFYIKNIFKNDYLGLINGDINLYSYSEDYNEQDCEVTLRDIDFSLNLCKPYIIATVDQLLLSMFKFPGYEKIFAAVKNASITVDEVHLLEPKMFLILIYFMQFACKYLNVDFHLMTTILPKSYKEQMINKGIIFQEESNENVTDKGEIVFIESNKEEEICEGKDVKVSFIKEKEIKSIVENALEKKQKILIIKNTIDSANSTYKLLKENLSNKYNDADINVLHNRFKFKDKEEKYNKIFDEKGDVWISTQEISLDIDFNIVISDLATMDSLIQRMSKCNSNDKYEYGNFYILPSKDEIYDDKLKNTTKDILNNTLKTNSIFTMSLRKNILDCYYDNGIVKKYFEDSFSNCDKEIKNIFGMYKNDFNGLDLIFNFEPYKHIFDNEKEASKLFKSTEISCEIILEEDFYKEDRDLQHDSIQISGFLFNRLCYFRLINKVEGYMVLKSSNKFEYNSTVGLILQ